MMESWPTVAGAAGAGGPEGFQSTQLFVEN